MNPFASILAFLFPTRCITCQKSGTALCQTCLHQIPPASPLPAPHLFAAFEYNHPAVRKSIFNLKYKHQLESVCILSAHAAEVLIDILAEKLITDEYTQFVFIPIPSHVSHKHKRGFNPANFVANKLASSMPQMPIKVLSLLIRNKKVKPQTSIKKRAARFLNMQHAFRCTQAPLPNTIAVIIDDVITTGATMDAATQALKEAGWKKVYGFALAHGNLHKKNTNKILNRHLE